MSVATLYHRHRKLSEAPAPQGAPAAVATPQPTASQTTCIGFWAIPYHEDYYLKLRINYGYTLDDKVKVQTIQSGHIEPAYAILANIKLLSRYFVWLREAAHSALKLWGKDAYTNPSNLNHEQALSKLTQLAIRNNWVFVVGKGDTAYIGYYYNLPPFANTLGAELMQGAAQKPENVKLPVRPKNVVGIVNGNFSSAQPIDEFFSKYLGVEGDPVRVLVNELFEKFLGDKPKVDPSKPDDAKDSAAVQSLLNVLENKIQHAPEDANKMKLLQQWRTVQKALLADKSGFIQKVVNYLRRSTAVTGNPRPPAPGVSNITQFKRFLAKYHDGIKEDSWADPMVQKFLTFVLSNDGKTVDENKVNSLYDTLHMHLGHDQLVVLERIIDSINYLLQNAHHLNNTPGKAANLPAPPRPASAASHQAMSVWDQTAQKIQKSSIEVHSIDALVEGLLQEVSFRQLYNSTAANGLYRKGGMKKVTGADASGRTVTHWIFDPSVPGRIANSRFVVTRPPSPSTGPDGLPIIKFNFKSRPDRSTTSMRALGFIKFLKEGFWNKVGNFVLRAGRPKVEMDRNVHVYCSCPDFKYRWHKALADKGAAHVPTGIGGEATNQDPVHTNPEKLLAICKHLCAMHDYLGTKAEDLGQELNVPKTKVSSTGKSVMPAAPTPQVKQGARASVKNS